MSNVAIEIKTMGLRGRRVQCDNRMGELRCGMAGQAQGEGFVKRVKTNPISGRTRTLENAAREYVWLYDYRHGASIGKIATREGVSVGRVRYGIARARAEEQDLSRDEQIGHARLRVGTVRLPRLVPLFPIKPYTPLSNCPHIDPIPPSSALCCMVCHCSGMDDHPALQRDPLTEPIPDPKLGHITALMQQKLNAPRETRKQRRKRLFASGSSATEGMPVGLNQSSRSHLELSA